MTVLTEIFTPQNSSLAKTNTMEFEAELARLHRRLTREKAARKQAEDILEQKSLELFENNQKLELLSRDLESQVRERTRELEIARDEALGAVKVKSEFVANMSHELRTPLNGVLGLIDMLKETELNEKQLELLRLAGHSGDLLLSVINDILDTSKIEAGMMDIESIPFDLSGLTQDMIAPFRFQAEEKGITLKLDFASNVPTQIVGDPVRIKQIMVNLISNAIKFTDNGQVLVKVSCRDTRLFICVEDTGMGMKKRQLSRVFEAFTQADASITRAKGGTGLGLSITNKLVGLMAGKIQVDSKLGKGSCFCIELPLLEANSEQRNTLPTSPQKQKYRFNKQKVLLVEDNNVNQMIATDILQSANLSVDVAGNGKVALDMVKNTAYAIILIDLQMPVMGGIEATKRLRQMPEFDDIPIISMSAHTTELHIKECKQSGMNGHLYKPYEKQKIFSLLARWLEHSFTDAQNKLPLQAYKSSFQNLQREGVDVSEALERVNQNRSLLKKLLDRFVSEQAQVDFKIQALLEKQNFKEVLDVLHFLKGTSANLSIHLVQKSSANLETLGKQGRWTEVREKLPEFSQALGRVCKAIRQIETVTVTESRAGLTIAPDEIQRLLKETRVLLHSDLGHAMDKMRLLVKSAKESDLHEHCKRILVALDNFDISSAEKYIDQIINERPN